MDIEPLNRLARLPVGRDRGAQRDARRCHRIGGRKDNHRIFSAQFEIGGDERPCTRFCNLAPGRDRTGEADIIDMIDERLPRLWPALDNGQHLGEFGNSLDGFAEFRYKARRNLRRLHQRRATSHQRGNRVDQAEQQREVPRRDRAEQLIGHMPVADRDARRRTRHVLKIKARDDRGGAFGPALEDINHAEHLDIGDRDAPGINAEPLDESAHIGLDRVRPLQQHLRPALRAKRPPCGLCGTQTGGGRGNLFPARRF